MFEKGEIEESRLNKPIIFRNFLRIACNWSPEISRNLAQNLLLAILRNCFIVIDEALNGIFGNKPERYTDNDIDSLRAIIYMMRCAIAHGPTAPTWKVRTKYRRLFKIAEIGYELDLSNLDGKVVNHSDYGNMKGAITLIDYSLKIVRTHSSN